MRRMGGAVAALLLCTAQVRAQHEHMEGDSARARISVGVSAIGEYTRVSPAHLGEALEEGYITQPVLMLHTALRPVELTATLDAEGLTLERGELTLGAFGEGYVERRHPHTYVHEAMLSVTHTLGRLSLSLAGGKGFAPFGTDDPMVRPFVKYPVNHHYSQLLERAVVVGAVRFGPAALELGAFNGEEPASPSDWPNLDRFGDSFAARASVNVAGARLQASWAEVESPEQPFGGGLDQRKWSASATWGEPNAWTRPYAHVEWARTADRTHGRQLSAFTSVLAEGAWRRGVVEFGGRYERTQRLEEERTSPFRTVRPATDFSNLGVTQWNIITGVARVRASAWRIRVEPFVEVARAHAKAEDPRSLFQPNLFFGDDVQVSFSAGVRVGAGMSHTQMGRYGVARTGTSHH